MTDPFFSSDTVRSAAPLKYVQTARVGAMDLELGGRLDEVTVAYETYGRLNDDRSNAVLICHALSGDSHVARHDEADDAGWWEIAIGPGKPIDTDRYFVICPNILGGCRGTTGPNSINPATGRRYGADFPNLTTRDVVETQRRLVDYLGIECLLGVIGGSMGGHQVLLWATVYPQRIRGAIPVATSARLSSQGLAFDVVARNAILRDPNFCNGEYYDSGNLPRVGLAIARMIGHITYLSREAMREKFDANRTSPRDVPILFEKKFSVGTYLGYQGAKFVERFDANSYMVLTTMIDLFDMGPTLEDLIKAFAPATCRWLFISFTSDWLFSPEESQEMVHALILADKPVSYCNVTSGCGHDAFLLEDDVDRYGELIRGFLASLTGQGEAEESLPDDDAGYSPTSMFSPVRRHRLDYDRLAELIPPDASVLDLGCGGGELLARLKQRGLGRAMGVELLEQAIVTSVRRGLDVVHADLNRGLGSFADGQFDWVVLSRTLQAIVDVELVINDIVRVGRRGLVSFPNFGYRRLRRMLAEQGRAPESDQLHYKWYNTPNIRVITIADFEQFCHEKGITIHRRIALDTEAQREVHEDPNLNADLALFVISR